MNKSDHTQDYVTWFKRGPFPGEIDPWAEDGRYFQQLHASMIDNIIAALQDDLLRMGYQAARETSLQIAAYRKPDVFVHRRSQPDSAQTDKGWDYARAAGAIQVNPGVTVTPEDDFFALHILDSDGKLVTVVEIISPRNKRYDVDIASYQRDRHRLFLEKGVNVVEIDATRSIKRLLMHRLTRQHPYHVAIFLPGDLPRLLMWSVFESPPTFALPLRESVLPVALESVYRTAYERLAMAASLVREYRYQRANLPFASTLTNEQITYALETVQTWQTALDGLR